MPLVQLLQGTKGVHCHCFWLASIRGTERRRNWSLCAGTVNELPDAGWHIAAAPFAGDLLQRTGGPADQDQVRTFPGISQGDGPADAARGPGDESETVGKALVRVHGVLEQDRF